MNPSEDSKTNSANLIIGLFLGFAAGALLGIAMAPAKGSETRRKVSNWFGDLVSGDENSEKDFAGKNDPEADRPV